MGEAVDLLQALRGHMGVDLRGGEARVPQHVLDAAQIGAALQKVGGEGVAQGMGRERLVQPRCGQSALEHLADAVGLHLVSPVADEEVVALPVAEQLRPRLLEIAGHGLGAPAAQGHDALLGALAEHLHLALGEVHPGKEKPGGLGDAGAAGEQEFQERRIAHLRRRLLAGRAVGVGRAVDGQQALHVAVGHDLREPAVDLGGRQHAGGIGRGEAGHARPAEERAQRRQVPPDGGAGVARLVELGEVAPQLAVGGSERIDARPLRPAQVGLHVLAIGAHRMGRGAHLGGEVIAEPRHRLFAGQRRPVGGVSAASAFAPRHGSSPASARASL